MIYENIHRNNNNILSTTDKFYTSYVRGAKIDIIGHESNSYRIDFVDNRTNFILYQAHINTNQWAKSLIEYFVDWRIDVYKDNELVFTDRYDAKDKRVYIALDSSSLGDTLAWIPYADEFRKTHNCELILSTFLNDMFDSQYPEIEFITPGDVVSNIYAQYTLGLFYRPDNTTDLFMNPQNPTTIPMQQIATDILGLPYIERRPKIQLPSVRKDSKLVTIAIHSTAQAKYWNNPTGWQTVVDYLKDNGYRVRLLSHEGDGYMGNKHPEGIEVHPNGSLEDVIKEMRKSDFFIGIGSGLTWLSWACNVPTVLISGFSESWTEMQDVLRIEAPEGKCSGCFNRVRLDAGDWNWCPDHKGTDRQFECTKGITGQYVIQKLKEAMLV